MGTGKLLGKPNKLRANDLRWTSILSRGSRNTPSRFMLQKPGVSSGSYGPVGSKASFFFFTTLSEVIKNLSGGHFHVELSVEWGIQPKILHFFLEQNT